jgi:hypothetical protein
MSNQTHKFLLFAALAFFLSCRESTQLTDTEKASISRDVRAMLQNYSDDIRLKGLHAEFAYLDSSIDFFWVPPGMNSPLPYDTIASMIRSNALMFQSVDMTWENLKIVPLTASLATYTGRLNSLMIATSGKVSRTQLVETGLVIKRNDRWKLLSGQTTLASPMLP